MIKTAIIIEIYKVILGTNIKRPKHAAAVKKKNIHASFRLISPEARGLSFVLATNLSNLWSLISLITQPQDLTKIEPIRTIRKPFSSKRFDSNIPSIRPINDGHNNRYIPTGLSRRASFI